MEIKIKISSSKARIWEYALNKKYGKRKLESNVRIAILKAVEESIDG